MAILVPTPPERMVDAKGRPYFLWDSEMDMATFRERLVDPDEDVRAYYIGKLMRQAKPDDVFTFLDRASIVALWERVVPYLGERRAMWEWLFSVWAEQTKAPRDP